MDITISNGQLFVTIASLGAELQRIYNVETKIDYLWSGDAQFWGKKSPVLFPIVGGLKNNQYSYQEKQYSLSRHGFARELSFQIANQSSSSVCFLLESTDETKKLYPFDFHFYINYTIQQNKLIVEYHVHNKSSESMYFSVGAHPAFKVPITDDTTFSDYVLHFNKVENCGIYPLSSEGLIEKESIPFFQHSNILPLKKELFYKDALVFKELQSNCISIKSPLHEHGLSVEYDDFPYMGIWSAKNADFICIEPWCGIADSVDTEGDISLKEGINQLLPNEDFKRWWNVTLY